ncbi:MAG: hypothetical protein QOE45_1517 [Frankiaceae bacterium]|nr:hypothetical protein [Frankiaceae bacterium]
MGGRLHFSRRKMTVAFLAVGALLLPAGSAAGAPGDQCGQPGVASVDGPYPVSTSRASVTTRDGERLDTYVWRPDAPAPASGWPMILLLPGANAFGGQQVNYVAPFEAQQVYACRGYVVVTYEARGYPTLVKTNGALTVNPTAPNRASTTGYDWGGPIDTGDSRDVIAWAKQQYPVNADRIAVAGCSYGGFRTWTLAGQVPELRTALPFCVTDSWNEFLSPSGVMHVGCALVYTATALGVASTSTPETLTECERMQLRGLAGDGNANDWMWQRSPARWAPTITMPVLMGAHTLDANYPMNGTVRLFNQLRGPKKLFLGAVAGHYPTPGSQQVLFHSTAQRWLDYWLKDTDTGIMSEPAVTWQAPPPEDPTSPSAAWLTRQTQSFPSCQATTMPLALSQGGTLTAAAGEGAADPVVNTYATGSEYFADVAPAANDKVPATPVETAVYTSAPFQADVLLAGPLRLQLDLTALGTRFQIHPDFWVLRPDGTRRRLAYSTVLQPTAVYGATLGQPAPVDFVPYVTAQVLPAGHRLQLTLSTSGKPTFVPDPTPGGYAINHSGPRQSTLTLTVDDMEAGPATTGGLESRSRRPDGRGNAARGACASV